MTKVFTVVYSINDQEQKSLEIENVPENVSVDEYKLGAYLKQKISKLEKVDENDIFIIGSTCMFKL